MEALLRTISEREGTLLFWLLREKRSIYRYLLFQLQIWYIGAVEARCRHIIELEIHGFTANYVCGINRLLKSSRCSRDPEG